LHLPTPEAPAGLPISFTIASFCLLGLLAAAVPPHGGRAWADELPSSADQSAQEVLLHEVEAQTQDNALWNYREEKHNDGKRKVLMHVYQTEQGEIDRMVAVNDQPLPAAQLRAEIDASRN
jgi:hypothetical protein